MSEISLCSAQTTTVVRQKELVYGHSLLMESKDTSPIKKVGEERATDLKGIDLIISFPKDLFYSFLIKSNLLNL